MDAIADTEVALFETQRGKSPITKRPVNINGHKTSVSLDPFWLELKSIAAERKVPLGNLISMIDASGSRAISRPRCACSCLRSIVPRLFIRFAAAPEKAIAGPVS
jgi:predicted DNA-binding ribbon-helix-helix protein